MDEKEFVFEITEEMIQRATTYVPLSEKMAFAKLIAPECLVQADIGNRKEQIDSMMALPPLYEENVQLKNLYLMQYFLTRYLNIDIGEAANINFSSEIYDQYASSHPMNQLERMKSNPAIKDKVFNLIADYKELKKILDVEIYNRKTERNDGLNRFMTGMALAATPEAVEGLAKTVESLKIPDDLKTKMEDRDKKFAEADKEKEGQINVRPPVKKSPSSADKHRAAEAIIEAAAEIARKKREEKRAAGETAKKE